MLTASDEPEGKKSLPGTSWLAAVSNFQPWARLHQDSKSPQGLTADLCGKPKQQHEARHLEVASASPKSDCFPPIKSLVKTKTAAESVSNLTEQVVFILFRFFFNKVISFIFLNLKYGLIDECKTVLTFLLQSRQI